MAFFEEFGKKISDAGTGVSRGARNLAEVSRLKGVVSDCEHKKEELFSALGRAYYEAHRGEIAGEQGDLIAELDGLESEIRRCGEQILALRGFGHCPACGARYASGAAFCSACGARLPEPAREEDGEEFSVPEEVLCPSCREPVAPGNLYCSRCGTRVTPAEEPGGED